MVRKTSFVTQQASRSALFEMSKDFVGVAMRLIQYGANVNATNSIHETPLHLATSSPPEIIELLINAQADPNSKDYIGQTPLCYAVREGQPSIVSLLAHLGADVNSPDILGEAPLSDAAGRGRPTWYATSATGYKMRESADQLGTCMHHHYRVCLPIVPQLINRRA
ncbi:hypothetical protein SLS57_005534 [Botryosphaeria dothidea]